MSELLFIEGGRVIDPASGVDGIRTLVIRGGEVAEVAERVERPRDARSIDARGLWVTPGFIDLHVHLREPGQEYKETIATGGGGGGGRRLHRRLRHAQHPAGERQRRGHRARARARRKAGLCRVYPVGAISKGSRGRSLPSTASSRPPAAWPSPTTGCP